VPGVEDVIVYVTTAPTGSGGRSEAEAVVLQEGLRIEPHVTAVRVGASVAFPNADDIYHNLFSLSETKRFNLGRYPPGESRSVTFDKPGLVRLFCDIHSDMAAVILVIDHGHFARPGPDGGYRLEGLPAGRHTVVAWSEGQAPDSVTVTVADGGTVRADFALGR
jgi:plastocyanin